MKILKNLILIFLLFISTSLYASQTSNCASLNGQVNPDSFSICEKDESFRILYEMFPDFFDEGLFIFGDYGEIEKLKDNQEIILNNQFKKFSNLLSKVFVALSSATIYIAIFFFLYFLFFTILRQAESGNFLDHNNISIGKNIKYISICFFFLIPIGDLIVIQVIVLFLAYMGISMANYVYGFYLASIQPQQVELFEEQKEKNINSIEKYIEKPYKESAAYIGAESYFLNLSKVALCRDISSQYIMEKNIYDLKNDNLQSRLSCSKGLENIKTINNSKYKETEYPYFFSLENSVTHAANKTQVEQGYKLTFGINKEESCETKQYVSYECGTMQINTPVFSDNELINIYGANLLYSRILSTINKISLEGNNEDIIYNDWLNIKKEIESKLKDNLLSDNEEKSKYADSVLNKKDLSDLKKVLYVYHQNIMNYLTVGLNIEATENNSFFWFGSDDIIIDFNNYNALFVDFEKAKEIAKNIQEMQCLSNALGLDKSYNFVNKLNSNSSSNTSLRCVDFDSMKVFGVDNQGLPIKSKDGIKQAQSKLSSLKSNFETHVEKIYKRRVSVENSMLKSLNDIGDKGLFVDLRQRGWLTFPSYLMELSSNIKTDNVYLKSLLGSNNIDKVLMADNGIASLLEEESDSATEYKKLNGLSNVFNDLSQKRNKNSIYADNSNFAKTMLENDKTKIEAGGGSVTDMILIFFSDPIEPLKYAIGLDMVDSDLDDKGNMYLMQKCMEDHTQCPFPKKDPIVELNRYGHYLINLSLSYFTFLIGTKSLAYVGKTVIHNKKLKELEDTDKAAGVSGDALKKRQEELKEKMNEEIGKKSTGSTALNIFLDALDIISEIIASLSVLVVLIMITGIFLAYILPLIPLFYFFSSFLAWLLSVLQVMLISSIWAVYFIRYDDNKELIGSAAKTYGMQIILKPVFMVIGLIFTWELIKVSLFFINITMFGLFQGMLSESFILSLLQNVIFLMLLVYFIGLVVKFSFSVMIDFSNKLFSYFDVEKPLDRTEDSSELFKAFLFHTATDKINSGTKKGLEHLNARNKNKETTDNYLSRLEQRIKELNDKEKK